MSVQEMQIRQNVHKVAIFCSDFSLTQGQRSNWLTNVQTVHHAIRTAYVVRCINCCHTKLN